MSALTHPIPVEWLEAYHDGELDAARRDRVAAHLPGCAECRRELEALQALSRALASDDLPQASLASPAVFWRGVQSRLPDRQAAGAPVSGRRVLLRWLPGFGLLLLNGLLQVAVVAVAILTLIPSRLWAIPGWTGWWLPLVSSSTLGWLAWLVPGNWSALVVIFWSLTLSGTLAVLYLAWLGFELRYGAPGRYVRAAV
jgi:anti-sigma factor RsiW